VEVVGPSAGEGVADVAARTAPAIVQVRATAGSGSGVHVAGGVVTNAHVVGEDDSVTLVLADGSAVPAAVARRDPTVDLALLTTDAEFPSVELAPSRGQRQGDTVLVLGYPVPTDAGFGSDVTLTRGIISAFRTVNDVPLVQTDAAVNYGNSGGALLTAQGTLIGIRTFTLRGGEGLNFAVASEAIERFLAGETVGTAAMLDLPSTAPPTPTPAPPPVDLRSLLVPLGDIGGDFREQTRAGEIDCFNADPPCRHLLLEARSPTGLAVTQAVRRFAGPDGAALELSRALGAQAALPKVYAETTSPGPLGSRAFFRIDGLWPGEITVLGTKGSLYLTVQIRQWNRDPLPQTTSTALAGRVFNALYARLP
jgi:hypothetical protein